jgi:hypothetical protein
MEAGINGVYPGEIRITSRQESETKGSKKMKKWKSKLSLLVLFLVTSLTNASVILICVDTDKDTYQQGEDIHIEVIAYNPGIESVTLTGGFYFTTYIMDGEFNWAEGKSGPAVILTKTIDAGESVTWNHTHGTYEWLAFPLEIGTHSLVGQVLAFELQEENESQPVEFTVIPEPTTFLLIGAGFCFLRRKKFISFRK